MTVKELIDELSKCNPAFEVKKTNWEGIYETSYIVNDFVEPSVEEDQDEQLVWI